MAIGRTEVAVGNPSEVTVVFGASPGGGVLTRWAFKMGFIVIETCDLIVVNRS